MMQFLPFDILDWVDPEKINLDIYGIVGPIGCFLKVDIYDPDELHDLHNDYPLAAGKVKVTKKKCAV